MKSSLILGVLLVVYLLIFGALFGSHNGIMGDMVHWDLHGKTKILNSLAIFGYLSIGAGIITLLKKGKSDSDTPIFLVLLLLIALSYGFSSVDCAIFHFCRVGE